MMSCINEETQYGHIKRISIALSIADCLHIKRISIALSIADCSVADTPVAVISPLRTR